MGGGGVGLEEQECGVGSGSRVCHFPFRLEPQSSAPFRAEPKFNFLSERKKVGSSRDVSLGCNIDSGSEFCMTSFQAAPLASPGDSQGAEISSPCVNDKPGHRKSENPDNSGS